MQNAYIVVDKFFDGATELRSAFETHFSNPSQHSHQHQIWNYWYVPQSYTYLRTSPTHIMPDPLVARFVQRINAWATANLGLSTHSYPWLSLYVDGCGQTIHNDSLAGQMGYVFSITKWDERTFQGGETLLFRPENYWETQRIKTSGAGVTFYDMVPSRFNQLLVFDDRVIHGVQPLMGTMDPLAGRVVMHGHLTPQIAVTGSLTLQQATDAANSTLQDIKGIVKQHTQLFHGFVTLRLAIQPDGRVASVRSLWDRILPLSPDKSRLDPFKNDVTQRLTSIRFPMAPAPSELTLPILIAD